MNPFDIIARSSLWLAILSVLIGIAYVQLPDIQGESASRRWARAFSQKWLMRTAVCFAFLSWVWNFFRLFEGDAYLRGSGKWGELSTILLGLIAVLVAVAWQGIAWRRLHLLRSWRRFRVWWDLSWRRLRRLQPWFTYGLAFGLILSSNGLLVDAPKDPLYQWRLNDRQAVAFVQQRLENLGCFEATGERNWIEGQFDTPTGLALQSFQTANCLVEHSQPGVIHPEIEFRQLTQPFPFLLGRPKRCPKVFSQSPCKE